MRAHAVDPEIDRHRMAQIAQVGQADAGQVRAIGFPRGRKRGEIAIGERQYDNVARRLSEIDGLDNLIEGRGAGGEQMHRLPDC